MYGMSMYVVPGETTFQAEKLSWRIIDVSVLPTIMTINSTRPSHNLN
jgi:hypothetical protein